jgi:pimeloyl-ACP methyl ester carboxylesterase
MGPASSVLWVGAAGARRTVVPAILAVLVLVGALAACGGGEPSAAPGGPSAPAATSAPPSASSAGAASSSPGPRPAGARCAAELATATQVRFPTAGGTSVAGVVLGSGRTAVLLFHTTQADVCQLAWYGADLVKAGYQVLLIDFSGDGASERGQANPAEDVVAAAAFMHGRGVTRIALLGASKGAIAVVGAAPGVRPAVLAVVSLSPPARFAGVDGPAAAAGIRVPVLYAVARGDGRFPVETQQLHDATPAGPNRRLVLVDGTAHGNLLLRLDATVRQAVDDFLRAHAAP